MNRPKTKQQIAVDLGISLRTLQRWIEKSNIIVPRGLISPKKQAEILIAFGFDNSSPEISESQRHQVKRNGVDWHKKSRNGMTTNQ